MDASLLVQTLPLLSVGSSIGIVSAAPALGIRHGIDWDHIAAITDITSTAASAPGSEERWLVGEPGVMLTDESHHSISHSHEGAAGRSRESRGVPGAITVGPTLPRHPHLHEPEPQSARISYSPNGDRLGQIGGFVEKQRPALVLGTMYALGHGSIVFVLGLLA